MGQATQVHHTSSDSLSASLVQEFCDVFKDELGVLKGIKATIMVEESATLAFTNQDWYLLLSKRSSYRSK